MRILIDMQGAQTESRFRGIGRYSTSLALAIAKNSGSHEIWLALNAQLPETIAIIRETFAGRVASNRIRIFDVPISDDPWTNYASELIREEFLTTINPDIVLVTSIFEGFWAKAVTSISNKKAGFFTAAVLYDLIPFVSPRQYLPTDELRNYYERKINWLKNADLLLAISEHSKKEGIEHLSLPGDTVVNISAAVGPQFKPTFLDADALADLKFRLGISRKIIMYTPGGFDSRKNFSMLIDAYSQLSITIRNTHQLAIVGKIHTDQLHSLEETAKKFGLEAGELILLGYVTDNELITLYSMATLFVFPSIHEGFGLPALEAMACGAPVIGSNTTSLPEVIGWHEALFDPFSSISISKKMERALVDDEFRFDLSSHGLSQSKKFTWDSCAQQTLTALEALATKNRSINTFAKREEKAADVLVRALGEIQTDSPPSKQTLLVAASCIAFNAGRIKRHLLLDISTLVQTDAKSGIQRVVRSLLNYLTTKNFVDILVRAIYFDGKVYRFAESSNGRYAVNDLDLAVDFCQGDIYLSLDLNMHLTVNVHAWHVYLKDHGIDVVFIVYDLLLIHHPEWWSAENVKLFRSWLNAISEVASTLVCISQSVSAELTEWLLAHPQHQGGRTPKVAYFHLGSDVENSQPSEGMPLTANFVLDQIRSRPSFLMVSTIEPRKGHKQVLAAFELLWASGMELNLVIVGQRGWMVEDLIENISSHGKLNKTLFWLEGISDEYLERVYQSSSCLIAASEGEGFGLPLIEAARHGIALIARDIPVFQEVAGAHAYYFAGLKATDLSSAVESWLTLKAEDNHPNSFQLPWLTWEQSTQQLLDVLDLQEATIS